MKKETIMCELFDFSIPTYYKRKKANNKAIRLIEKYFSNQELKGFIKSEQIQKMENLVILDSYYDDIINEMIITIEQNSFSKKIMACFFDISKEEIEEFFSHRISTKNTDKSIYLFVISLFNKKKIDEYDITSFLSNTKMLTSHLINFIIDNIKLNWKPLEDKIKNGEFPWLLDYINLLSASVNKGIYSQIFMDANPSIGGTIVPNTPYIGDSSGCYEDNIRIYSYILKDIFEDVKNNNLEKYEWLAHDSKPYSAERKIFETWTKDYLTNLPTTE